MAYTASLEGVRYKQRLTGLTPKSIVHRERDQLLFFFPPKPKPVRPGKSNIRKQIVCRWEFFSTTMESGFNPTPTHMQRGRDRDVSTEAGRSKKRAGQSSSGRLEGRAKQRRAQEMIAERRRRLKALRDQQLKGKIVREPWKESKLYSLLYGQRHAEDQELTEEELQMVGLGYERSFRYKEKDDPSLRHPHDWFKYGPYGPHAWKGVFVGKPIKGRFYHNRVTMFTTVKDAEEQERIDQHDAVVDYDRKIRGFDENIGVKYFWVFVRKTFREEPLMPWDEWTLVSQVAVESGEGLDKYEMGHMVGVRSRNLITRCTAWFRPDLIYVKKPIFQMRFEPQEEFFRHLVGFLDPLTEVQHRFKVPSRDGDGEEDGMNTYYGVLCEILRVDQSASDDDVVKAYEKLEEQERSLCWDFVLSNHPVELLHPFTKGWRAREQAMATDSDISDSGVGDEGENVEEEDNSDDEEAQPDSLVQQEMYWEKQFEKTLSDFEEAEFMEIEDSEMNEGEFEKGNEEGEIEFFPQFVDGEVKSKTGSGNSEEKLGRVPQSVVGEEEGKNETVNARNDFVRSAVRPFTYMNLLIEIALLRHTLVEQRNHTNEPIMFF